MACFNVVGVAVYTFGPSCVCSLPRSLLTWPPSLLARPEKAGTHRTQLTPLPHFVHFGVILDKRVILKSGLSYTTLPPFFNSLLSRTSSRPNPLRPPSLKNISIQPYLIDLVCLLSSGPPPLDPPFLHFLSFPQTYRHTPSRPPCLTSTSQFLALDKPSLRTSS
jgi:hypothetical protein